MRLSAQGFPNLDYSSAQNLLKFQVKLGSLYVPTPFKYPYHKPVSATINKVNIIA